MRGVMVLLLMTLFLVVYMFFAPAAIEPVGEEVRGYDTLTDQNVGTIDRMYTALFRGIPLVVFFGLGAWGVAWYIRRNRLIGRG